MGAPPSDLDSASSEFNSQRFRPGDINLRAGPQMLEYLTIADRVAREMPEPVLDWGCGHGQITFMLRQREVDVTPFDWNPHADPEGELVRLPHYPEIRAYHSSDPVRLPFPDDSFGCVLSCGVLEHVEQPERSLHELQRVLRPGGRLLVYKLPNRFSYIEAAARRLGYYYHGALPDDKVYTRRSALELVSQHGFRIDGVRLANLLPLVVSHPYTDRFSGLIWAANRALGRVPGLRVLATNVELDATAV